MGERIIVLVALAVILAGCGLSGPALRGSGMVASETRDVGNFTHITMGGVGELTLRQGEETSVMVEADDNLLPYIETVVEGDTLRLSIDVIPGRSVRPRRPIRYTITMPTIEGLRSTGATTIHAEVIDTDRLTLNVSGSGDIIIDRLQADEIIVEISGSGNVGVAGRVEAQQLQVGGSGSYFADDLESRRISAQIQGSGEATVWASESLDARISGSGDLRYYGSPQTNVSPSGSGSLTPLGER
ncbi:MAG: GIN domain-containing protein [Anaerolineae bacterium]|jgi:hypothetical protein